MCPSTWTRSRPRGLQRETTSPTVNRDSHGHVRSDSDDLPDASPSADDSSTCLHVDPGPHKHANARTQDPAAADDETDVPPAGDPGPHGPPLPCADPLSDRHAHPVAYCHDSPRAGRCAHHRIPGAQHCPADGDRHSPDNCRALTRSRCEGPRDGRLSRADAGRQRTREGQPPCELRDRKAAAESGCDESASTPRAGSSRVPERSSCPGRR